MSFSNLSLRNQRAIIHFSNNHVDNFKKALHDGANVNVRMRNSNYTLFETACQTPGKGMFIELCLKHDASVKNQMNATTEEYPIHLAALSLDRTNLIPLLTDDGNDTLMVKQRWKGRTALLLLCERLPDDDREPVFECIKLLLEHGANINAANNDNVTPIELLLEKNDQHLVEQCLQLSTVEVRSSLRRKISDKFPGVCIPRKAVPETIVSKLTEAIMDMREEVFLDLYKRLVPTETFERPADLKLLLLCAVKQGNLSAAKRLVQSEMVDGKLKPSLPLAEMLVECCVRGRNEMLEWLLPRTPKRKCDEPDILNETPLITLLVKTISTTTTNRTKWRECMKMLLADPRIEMDQRDTGCLTALQYAVQYGLEDVQELLLSHGAYVGGEDRFGSPLVSELSPHLLEKHLDSCVTDNGSNLNDADYKLHLTFANFLSPTHKSCCRRHQGKQHCGNSAYEDEMLPIVRIAQSPSNRRLLRHPVIASILFLKWLGISAFFYVNLCICSVFFLSFTCFLVFYYGPESKSPSMWVFLVPTLLGLGYITLRELFQLFLDPRDYFRSLANCIEVVLIVSSATALTLHFTTGDEQIRNIAEVVAILLSAVEFTVLLATIPRLSFCTHMVMLKTVAKNFVRCLSLYSMILVAFAISFYTLLRVPPNNNGPNNTTEYETNPFNEFRNLSLALLKTAVMMTGEYEAASLRFEQSWGFYVVFTLFLFFVPIVLFNLMNGLAVNDTTTILAESELIAIQQKIYVINSCERTLKTVEQIKSLYKKIFQKHPHELMANLEYIHIKPNNWNEIIKPKKTPRTKCAVRAAAKRNDGNGTTDVELGTMCRGPIVNESSVVGQLLAALVRYSRNPEQYMDVAIVSAMQDIIARRRENAGCTADFQMRHILRTLSAEMGDIKEQLAAAMQEMKGQISQEIKNEIKDYLNFAK